MDRFPSIHPLIDLRKAEFVPSALRNTYGNTERAYGTRLDVPGSSKKAVLDRSESSISNNSDDEAHQYWCCQLPDDITPDFGVIGEEESHGAGRLSLAGLSIQDSVETSRFSTSSASQTLGMRQNLSSFTSDGLNLGEKMGYSGSIYTDEHSSAAFMTSASSPWGKPFINAEQHQTNGRDGHHYNGNSSAVSVNDLIGDNAVIKDAAINPIEFLSSQFPGFAAQSLANVYYGNGCDLNLTIEILTQLELQADGGFNQNLNSNSLATPSLSMLDFPGLPVADAQSGLLKYPGEDKQQAPNTYSSTSSIFRGGRDFASTVRKLATQRTGHWGYERNSSVDDGLHSSRSSQLLASSYGHRKMAYGDKLQSSGATRAAPVWLETGEAVASMYLESREDARDFARLRNTCFEQARQAYLLGNKALAKELSLKGQVYNMQMKAAHEKAKETIYQKRNPLSPAPQGSSGGQDHLIDLHGLHVAEAIHVLNREFSILRSRARSTGQRLQVMICVGTGHHTKGTRTPARLPAAVEQYLVEEGLPCTQLQPGLLRVVIY
ncbi:polyadenylate-binding protein-interacting protein 7-like isoform X2 [Phoenix dactylifera]|uniref:Polyadenylate-binding protein-interacting protein 7-like isoform X2 n=1 Tax=Phoenix dactylifera TaxID=42345 RepID=A0A8B8J9W7_PHODC|nr:polyadenylate-binding protein-interacting protein 7-like isoform X2 [Phoenix dactylifera]